MTIELQVPTVGESITETVIGEWLVAEGGWVAQDEPVVVIETDKVNVELPAPADGFVSKVLKAQGDVATVGETIGIFEPGERPAGAAAEPPRAEAAAATEETSSQPPAASPSAAPATSAPPAPSASPTREEKVLPAARRALHTAGLEAQEVSPSGPGGRLLKEDVLRHAGSSAAQVAGTPELTPPAPVAIDGGARGSQRVRMSPLRRRLAERLVSSQQNAALLTTFNEIDMSAVIALRKRYQTSFQERYGIKLGFMSFFVKATITALSEIPAVNATIEGEEIVFYDYYDIGVAVGGGKGLVVPVLRSAERLSFAEVELAIADFGARAKANKLKLDELTGGTFTISNGGIYGSLLSTPIVNPPQSGILGMHNIVERPVAIDGQVAVRPMMYVALTYDHRLVDGREAVTFLVRVKQAIEDPARILLEV